MFRGRQGHTTSDERISDDVFQGITIYSPDIGSQFFFYPFFGNIEQLGRLGTFRNQPHLDTIRLSVNSQSRIGCFEKGLQQLADFCFLNGECFNGT